MRRRACAKTFTDFAYYRRRRGEEAESIVARHRIFKSGTKGPFLGGVWPMMDEVGPEEGQQDQRVADPTPPESEPAKELVVDPPYFVSISRRSDCRRLHKNYCCGVMPWQCYKLEWVHEVKAGTADAYCQRCLKACGKLGDAVDSSSSGTSSSTEDQPD